MKGIILAGGFGTRLMPLTDKTPKPLMEVINNPLIDYSVRLLKKADASEIICSLFHMADTIEDFCAKRYGRGASISFAREESPIGSGGAVKLLENKLRERFFVLSGDVLSDVSLARMLERHTQSGAIATIAAVRVDNPIGYGVIDADHQGFVQSFLEKPQIKISRSLVNTGIYILEPEVFSFIPSGKPYDFGRDLFPHLVNANQKVAVFQDINYWRDCGSVANLYNANMDALARKISFKAFEGGFEGILNDCGSTISPTTHAVVMHKQTRISNASGVFPFSAIGENVALCPHCIVSGAVVLKNSELTRSAINAIARDNERYPAVCEYQSHKSGEFIGL